MLELQAGWLNQQVQATLEEMQSWPKWMKIETDLRKKAGSKDIVLAASPSEPQNPKPNEVRGPE